MTIDELAKQPSSELIKRIEQGDTDAAIAYERRMANRLSDQLDQKCRESRDRYAQIVQLRLDLADARTSLDSLRLKADSFRRLIASLHDDLIECGNNDGDGSGLSAERCDELVGRISEWIDSKEPSRPFDTPGRTSRELGIKRTA